MIARLRHLPLPFGTLAAKVEKLQKTIGARIKHFSLE
jgi:hypothetical protein